MKIQALFFNFKLYLYNMKTIVVNVPDKEENFFITMMKKFRFKSRVLTDDEKRDMAMAKWIDEGMTSEEVSQKKVYETLREHGVKI